MRRVINEHRSLSRIAAACVAVLFVLFRAPIAAAAAPLGDDDDLIVLGIPKVTLLLTNPPANNVYAAPASIAMTATAKVAAGSISRVDYYQSLSLIGSATTTPYSFTWGNVGAGQYALAARATSSLGFVNSSVPVSVRVCDVPTISLTAPMTGAILPLNTGVALQATAASPANACAITKVEFYAQSGGNPVLVGTAAGNPPYQSTWTPTVGGGYGLTAKVYDERNVTATSTVVNVTVDAPPTISITAPASGAVITPGTNIAFTVNAADSDGSVTKVEYYNGATLIGTATTAPFGFTWLSVAKGNYTITAKAYDNLSLSTTSAAVSLIVTQKPTVSITAPANNAVVAAGTNVTISAAASDPDGSIAKVEFYQGATLLCMITTSPYNCAWNGVPAGSYTLTAKAYDDQGATTTSLAVTLIADQPAAVSITAPANNAAFTAPATIPITATATDADGTIANIEFYQGSTLLGTVNTGGAGNSGSSYTFTWSNVVVGNYALTAKAYDNLALTTTSATVNVTVTGAVSIPAPTALKAFAPASVPTAAASVMTITLNPKLFYVSNYDSNTISVVNSATNTVLATIPASTGPYYNAVTARGDRAYVANFGANTVSVIDTASNTIIATVPVGATPVGIATNPTSAFAYVANYGGTTLSVINTTANSVAATVTVGTSPINVVVNPAGTRVYVTNFGSNSVSVINAATNAVIATIPVGVNPRGIAVNPAGTVLYVANSTSKTVSVVNATTNAVTATIPVGNYPIGVAVNPAGSRVYVANYNSNTVSVIDTASNTVIATVPVGTQPAGVMVHLLGTKVYASNRGTNTLSIIDTATNTVSGTITVGAGPWLQTNSMVAAFAGATTGAAFTDAYPAGLVNTASAAPATTCGGTVTAANGGNSLALSGGTIPANDSCSVTVNVTSASAGSYANSTGAISTTNAGNGAAASATLTVTNRPPVVSINPPVNGAQFASPGTVAITATATDPDGTVTKVEFYQGAVLLGTVNTGGAGNSGSSYTFTWSNVAAGQYSLTAKAYDDAAAVTVSSAVSVAVCGLPTTMLTSPPAGQTVAAPGTFTLSANASTNAGCSIQKVEFYNGATLLNTDTTSPFSFSWSGVAVGSYTVKARGYDTLGQFSDSASVTVTVITDHPPTISSVTPTTAQVLLGDSITFTVVAADSDGGNTLTAQLLNGSTPIGSVTQLAGTNTFVVTWVPGSTGTYNLTVQITDNFGLSATQAVSATVSSVQSGTVGDADLVCTIPVSTSGVGTTAGVFGVSESGAATYSIPIQVPPGTAGVQPSLALSYNSQGGDGHLGAGWSLSGLSAIARCPATEAQDGARIGINYDDQPADDAFCIDGQRLIAVGKSPDGTQTEYRTEIDGFARIARYDDTLGLVVGAARFRVWTKSGQILDYGSRWWIVSRGWYQHVIEPTRLNSVKVWVLDKVSDRVGNYMEIDYEGTNNAVTRSVVVPPPPFNAPTQPIGAFPDTEFWPSVIRYYGVHDVGVSTPGYNEVKFVVSDRATVAPLDVQRFYDQGAGEATLTKKLDAIQITVDKSDSSAGTLVRSYYLNYAASVTSKRLLLQSVQECAPDGSGTCLTPTAFGWTTTALSFQGQGSTSAGISIASDHAYNVKVADLDGDGRSDMIRYVGSSGGLNSWEVCLGPLTQGGACQTYTIGSYGDSGDITRWQVADIEGIGKADLITYDTGSQSWKVCRFNGSGFDPCQLWTGAILYRTNTDWNEFFWGDFDGDGKIDIMSFKNTTVTDANGIIYYLWDVCLSTGTGFNCQRNVPIRQITAAGHLRNRVLIADLNGDGKADYLERQSETTTEDNWNVCLADFGPGASQQFNCAAGTVKGLKGDFDKFVVMDLNGDGLADMMTRVDTVNVPAGESCIATNNCWQVCLSAGDGAFEFYDPNVHWTDQGLVDGSGNAVDPYTAPRCRFWSGLSATYTFGNVLYGDFNGDGRTDMAVWDSTSRTWTVCYSTGTSFNCQSGVNFPMPPNLSDTGTNNDKVRTGDFNGDGKTDILVQNSQTSWAFGFAGDGFADQIQTITTGLGATTNIAYVSLTDASVYKKGNPGLGARELVIQSPLYVVKETQASNALGGQFINTYFYEGLKGRTDGRGIEGFFRRRMLDGNGILSEVEIEQTWPLTGRPRRTTKWAPINGNRPNPASVLPTSPVDVANGALVKVNEATQTWSSRSYGAGSPYQGGTIGAIAEPRSFARFVYQVHTTGSSQQSFEFPNGTALPQTTTTIPLVQIDVFGNVQQITAQTFDAAEGGNYTKLTQNTYSNDGPNWIVGRLISATVTSTKPTGEQATRASGWTYGTIVPQPDHPFDNACWWGFVCKETIEPGHAGDTTNFGLWQETQYAYDRFGNKVAATVSFLEKDASGNVALKQRTSNSCYANAALCAGAGDGAANNRGRFALSVTNALSQTETRQYDTRFGAASVVNGPNGLSSTILYDRLGRKVCGASFDGQNGSGHLLGQSETLVQSCSTSDGNPGPGVPAGQVASYTSTSVCQAGESYRVRTKASGNAGSYVFFDNLQRERRTVAKAFNDQQWATVATTYDPQGRKQNMSKPAGSGTITTTLGYDVLNRVTTETTTGNGGGTRTTVATTTYSALTTSVTRTNPSGSGSQTTSRTVNSQGQVTLVRDANNKNTTFLYDAFGNLKQATGPTGIAVTMTYDLRGRKASMVDPDMGSWSYFYNGVGELTRQRDGKAQDTRLIYDVLGRMVERREYTGAEGGNTYNGTLWSYDSCGLVATGKLCSTETHSAFPYSTANLISKQASTYDSAARPATTTTTIGSVSYISATQYDANGRVSQIEYPSGLIVKQTYTAWAGHSSSVTDATGGTTYWQATNRMTDGQIASMKVGPHTTTKSYDPLGRVATVATAGVQNATYVFDEVGNLTRRVDATVGQADETYGYDLLNRLTTANAITIASYDDAGNITSRSGTGNYAYFAGTHRLANINGSGIISYDNNGNFASDFSRTVTSTAFNMPSRITGGGNTLDFAYDSSHARVQEVSSASGITNFVSSQFYEEQFRPDGSTYRRHYIGTPEGVVALIVQRYRPQGNDTLIRYWHKDHLGSVAVITTDTALIVERFTYDVWGRRIQQFIATGEPLEERGYTGHETLDDVAVAGIGLVHMNGRIYDPFTGRFLSADPFVQSPYDGQSYNRYSYVLNNPLSFTDPTGFSWWTKWRRPIIGLAVGAFTGWVVSGWLMDIAWAAAGNVMTVAEFTAASAASNFVGALAGGFASGGIMGGNLESALQGAFSAALFFGAGSIAEELGGVGPWASGGAGKVGLHALVGCVGTVAAGGSCGKGAAAGGFAEFAGPYVNSTNPAFNVVTHAVTGGIGAVLAGGKFENGAITGTFGYLFNCLSHPGKCTPDDVPEIRRAAEACNWNQGCIRGLANYAREAGLPVPRYDMGQSITDFFEFGTSFVRIFTPPGRMLDLGIDAVRIGWSGATETSDWVGIISGDAYALFVEHALKPFNVPNFAGSAGAIAGKWLEPIVDNIVKGRTTNGP